MTKTEFLAEIREKIQGLPQSDIEKFLDYYAEMIDDYTEDGRTQEEAIGELGSVEEIVEQILKETPLPHLVQEKVRPSRALLEVGGGVSRGLGKGHQVVEAVDGAGLQFLPILYHVDVLESGVGGVDVVVVAAVANVEYAEVFAVEVDCCGAVCLPVDGEAGGE